MLDGEKMPLSSMLLVHGKCVYVGYGIKSCQRQFSCSTSLHCLIASEVSFLVCSMARIFYISVVSGRTSCRKCSNLLVSKYPLNAIFRNANNNNILSHSTVVLCI